jgi:branched chain amino acid efflux pump
MYDSFSLWSVILLIGVLTFLIRFSFIWLFGNSKVNPTIQRLLQFVPPAVLTALILPSFVLTQDSSEFSMENPRMWAGIFASLVAWKTKNVMYTISTGLALLWLFTNY